MPDRYSPAKAGLKKIAGLFSPDTIWRLLPYSLLSGADDFGPRVSKREQVYDMVIPRSEAIVFLEFGTFEGASIRYIAALNTNHESRFIGFDTFEGLPHAWGNTPKGHFNTNGAPAINDERVSFSKGLFRDTVPAFIENPVEGSLVIHIDSDLYISAMTALLPILMLLRPSALTLIFDEFCGEEAIAFNQIEAIFDNYTFTPVAHTVQKYGYPFCVAFDAQRRES